VAAGIRLSGTPAGPTAWLDGWRRADEAARRAVDSVLDEQDRLTEPRLARDLLLGVPEDALVWAASSMPVRDIDFHAGTRADVRILASRGTSGIDGTVSAAVGAALAHDGPAFALIGDLAFLHDAPGLALGPDEPRPDLCLVVVNNDGGGIFSTLEQAAFTRSFERLFGTPHGAALDHLAAAFGLPYQRLDQPEDLGKALPGTGLRIVEAQTDRAAGAALRTRLREVAVAAVRSAGLSR
jgi:2-succinyl-5-enolpyruvyl-6-hydroxy-3-cyclohexene-1-carboxylate synthase